MCGYLDISQVVNVLLAGLNVVILCIDLTLVDGLMQSSVSSSASRLLVL